MRLLAAALVPPAPVWNTPETDLVTIRLDLKTMTPVFGGGHTAREVDPVQAVRPSAIRGQLRYWWRATAGARFASTSDLYKEESRIFGNTDKAGVVRVRVPRISAGRPQDYDKKWGAKLSANESPGERIFVFPFQPIRGETRASTFFDSLEFTLEVQLSRCHQVEITNAIKAWLVFGGVGARTRRGCGALALTDPAQTQSFMPPSPGSPEYHTWFANLVGTGINVKPAWARLLGTGIVIGHPNPQDRKNPYEVWRSLGKFWCNVRKNHFPVTDFKPTDATKWADELNLRLLRPQDTEIVMGKHLLGLPIIYQGMNGSFRGDVTSAQGGRAASPVILKPVQLATGDVAPLVALLHTPFLLETSVQVNKRLLRVKLPGEHTANLALKNAASKRNGFDSPIHIIKRVTSND